MTDSREAVALDALRELGLERLTVWHLRCLESMLSGVAKDVDVTPSVRWMVQHRLWGDLSAGPDIMHAEALEEDRARKLVVAAMSRSERLVTDALKLGQSLAGTSEEDLRTRLR